MKNKFFPICDGLHLEDWQKLGMAKLSYEKRLKISRDIKAVATSEFRAPKAGEWYLSGAIVGAYRASQDFSTKYHIAKLALTQTTTKTVVTIRSL